MIPLAVQRLARWSPEQGTLSASLLPTAQRRRCSLMTRMVAEVLGQLVDEGTPFGTAALVCCTAYGELATSVDLLRMIQQGDPALSPIRFAGSVHNTAIGQVAIATDHRGVSTTVSAGGQSVAMALVECLGLLAAGHADVVLVCADEPLTLPVVPAWDGLAVAFHLRAETAGACAVLTDLEARADAPDPPRVPLTLAANPCAPAWVLADTILRGENVRITLTAPAGPRRSAVGVDVQSQAL